jgi:CHAT domain-containing protein
MRHPDTGDIDDRHLCEYGLVREIRGQKSARRLAMKDWVCLEASYPAGSAFSPVGGHTATLRAKLEPRAIALKPIAPNRADALAALSQGTFDVLHIVCHGISEHDAIDSARLIIGEQAIGAGRSKPVVLDPVTVGQEARQALRQRRPIVFLNACESGRHGASLTAWGGWPTAFLKAGAGVFVGAAWPIREAPAGAFAAAFYDALLQEKPLVEATNAARAAARKWPDASWLAYRVFGHPNARFVS